MNAADHHRLRTWDNDHVWHPFTAMEAYREEGLRSLNRVMALK